MRGAMLLRQKMNVMSRGGVTCLLAAAMSVESHFEFRVISKHSN